MGMSMTIEAALVWAYRDELVKAAVEPRNLAAAFGGPGRMRGGHEAADAAASLWARPDNAFGVVPVDCGDEPHRDALAIHAAVLALDAIEPVLPDDWCGWGDVDLGPCAAAVAHDVRARLLDAGGLRLRNPLSVIIRRIALLGLPDAGLDEPELLVECGANGKPRWFRRVEVQDAFGKPLIVEVDGYDRANRRPFPDAYARQYLDPSPVEALVARLELEAWRAALDVLVEDLEGALEEVELLPSSLPERPWEAAASRVLPDLTAGPRPVFSLRPRKTA